MATLVNLPHEVQHYISNFLRPHSWIKDNVAQLRSHVYPDLVKIEVDPLSKARDIAIMKAVHPNLKTVPLWKNHEWKEHIRKWRDKRFTMMRWKYEYGKLSDKMIRGGWEKKINNIYRHQNCYVETTVMKGVGRENYGKIEEFKIIWFEVSLLDLITGIRPLPHCFGNNGNNGIFQITRKFVPAPTLETLIPADKRREWLIKCFKECVVKYWGRKIVQKNGCCASEKYDFIKEFKKLMDLPSNYELSYTQLFRMFLRELCVRSIEPNSVLAAWRAKIKCSENIEQICQQTNINFLNNI